jgi:hypothetical protein
MLMKRSIVVLSLLLAVTRLFAPPLEDFKKALREARFAAAVKLYPNVAEKEALRALFEIDPLGIPVKEAVMLLDPLSKIKHEVYAQLVVSPSWQQWLRTNLPELDFVIISASGTETPPPSESDGNVPGAPDAPDAPDAPPVPDEPSPAAIPTGLAQRRLEEGLRAIESATNASAAYAAFKEASPAVRKQLYVPLLTKYGFSDFKPSEKSDLINSFFASVSNTDAAIARIKAQKPANAAELEKTQSQAAMASELEARLKRGSPSGRRSTVVGAVTQADKESVQAGLYTYAAAKKAWQASDWKKTVAALNNFENAANKKAIRKEVYKNIVQEMVNDIRTKWAAVSPEYKKELEALITNAGIELPRLLMTPRPTPPPLPAGKRPIGSK